MDEEITHEIERRNLDGIYTQTGASGSGSDFGWHFNQFDIFHDVDFSVLYLLFFLTIKCT
jgi:hypothetical protein